MLSLPPIAGSSKASSAVNAPKSAAKGWPQSSVLCSLGKYSWHVRRSFAGSAPSATARVTDSTTAYSAPWNGLQQATSGLYPHAITDAAVVLPCSTGSLPTMPSDGVSWRLPPNGISTVPRPIVLSKRSESPFWLQTLRRPRLASHAFFKPSAAATSAGSLSNTHSPSTLQTLTSACWATPLVFKKSRERSTILSPRQYITSLLLSLTCPITVASRFSSSAKAINFLIFSGAITSAMRS